MPWAAAAAVAGSYISSEAAKSEGAANRDAAARAAEGAKFNPFNVSGAFGSGSFDGQNASGQLNPQMQQIQDRFGQQALNFSGQGQTGIGGLAAQGSMGFMQAGLQSDPNVLAQGQFDKMQSMLSGSRGRSKDALEARLLRQGRLGSTGGALSEEAQMNAFNQQDQRMMIDAMTQGQAVQAQQLAQGQQLGLFGQQQQDVGFNQAQSRLGGVQGLDAQMMKYLEMGSAFGGRQSAAGANAGAFGMRGQELSSMANLGAAKGWSNALGDIGTAMKGMDWGSSSPYNAETGGGTLAAKTDAQWADNWDY